MNRDAPNFYGIIPARYASSRFPGKPLADIAGKPMFWHVYHRARRCSELSAVYLATDDERILEAAQNLDVPALATRKDHPSGTDRVFEAAHSLGIGEKDVVLNIQGDEPVLDPLMVSELVRPFADPEVSVATPARRMDQAAAESPDRVKVVFSEDKKALYFSRSRIPYPREGSAEAVYGHIGMYAFRMAALRQFVHLPPSRLESIEKLEQLRLLENHIPVHVVITECDCLSVDRPEDIEAVVHRIHAEYARDSGKI
jgi:3-deoxy-manno-octulosonate cytidylyltransferase (CMP-KDO synthetase)